MGGIDESGRESGELNDVPCIDTPGDTYLESGSADDAGGTMIVELRAKGMVIINVGCECNV